LEEAIITMFSPFQGEEVSFLFAVVKGEGSGKAEWRDLNRLSGGRGEAMIVCVGFDGGMARTEAYRTAHNSSWCQ